MNTFAVILLISAVFASPRTEPCPDAPLPRLQVGVRGEVAPGINRLRLRLLPAVGTGEVHLLYAGNQFEVLAGPSCNGGYNWWRVALDSGETGWAAEGTWAEYFLRPLNDENRTLCECAEAPWLHLLMTVICTLLRGIGS
jgi:hypothetical protein